jgi:hypothetical protein
MPTIGVPEIGQGPVTKERVALATGVPGVAPPGKQSC